MSKEIKCFGCGAIIQSENEKHIGYVPKSALEKENVLCKRCFQLKNYHRIQDSYMTKDDFLNILQEKKREEYLILIVSNAPEELLINAAKNLNVEYLSAPPYLKGDVLKLKYSYKYLFVCTDNKSDLDLLLLSDDAVITCKNRHKPFFEKKLKNKKYYFLEG